MTFLPTFFEILNNILHIYKYNPSYIVITFIVIILSNKFFSFVFNFKSMFNFFTFDN